MDSVLVYLLLCISGLHLTIVSGQGTLRFVAMGDWGYPALPGPPLVADLMADWCLSFNCQFILTTGDNFYPNGVNSPNDPYFDHLWRYQYNHTSLADLVWYITVGNHDYGHDLGEEWYQVEFGKIEPRWHFPHLWHSFHMPAQDADVHFVVIDTEVIQANLNNRTVMMMWLENELKSSTSKWKIVVGHRPIYSSGDYGPVSNSMYDWLHNLLIQYKVDIYLTGHDHNLQHLNPINETNVEYVISGGGGAGRYAYRPAAEDELRDQYGIKLNYFGRDYGFVGFEISNNEIHLQYITLDEGLAYEYTIEK